jgi:crotonobetainyl-CoA:carnitine CoA-transferase CaiB-like acyl-CoA transferase
VHAPPYIIDGERAGVRHHPPHLGEHTAQVLRELLGMGESQLESLASRSVIK